MNPLKHLFAILFLTTSLFAIPDTTGNSSGWRYATTEDIDYWHNVNDGDVIIFSGEGGSRTIYSATWKEGFSIAGGSKIHLWRGKYNRIMIHKNGWNDTSTKITVTDNTADKPIIITNLGGQIEVGQDSSTADNRGIEIYSFDHVFLTGEYDPVLGTGDSTYLGLKGDLTKPGWKYNFGISVDQKFTSFHVNEPHGLGVKITKFNSAKIRGVAALHGYFAGFSVKNDPVDLRPTVIDIQNTLSGWHEGEGYYLGYNGSGPGEELGENKLTFINNVAMFTGAEGLQADFLAPGSVIKNNFIYKTGAFYQVAFQAGYQDNGIQWSFTRGNVEVSDNIFYVGSAGNAIVGPKPLYLGTGRETPEGDVRFHNNLVGPSRTSIGYIFGPDGQTAQESIDSISILVYNNVFDSITNPKSNDADENYERLAGYYNVGNNKHDILLKDNIYPEDNSFYMVSVGDGNNITSENNTAHKAPELLLHENFGFDPTEILNFRGVWKDGSYNDIVAAEGPISYRQGDVVYLLWDATPRYYKCLVAHDTPSDPRTETSVWQKLEWGGNEEPAYTPLLAVNSYYNHREMGLTLNPTPTADIDTTAPVITAPDTIYLTVNEDMSEIDVQVMDSGSVDLSSQVRSEWVGKTPEMLYGSIVESGLFTMMHSVRDNAGNHAKPAYTIYHVSDCQVSSGTMSMISFHHYGPKENVSALGLWQDLQIDKAAPATTILNDTAGEAIAWNLTIPYDSENDIRHNQISKMSGSPSIGTFPEGVVDHGLSLRQSLEIHARFILDSLDHDNYYDVFFTGYRAGEGSIVTEMIDSMSMRSVQFNMINNDKEYVLEGLQPDSLGTINIDYLFVSAEGQETTKATTSLAGLRIVEKTGFGKNGLECVDPPEEPSSSSEVVLSSSTEMSSGIELSSSSGDTLSSALDLSSMGALSSAMDTLSSSEDIVMESSSSESVSFIRVRSVYKESVTVYHTGGFFPDHARTYFSLSGKAFSGSAPAGVYFRFEK